MWTSLVFAGTTGEPIATSAESSTVSAGTWAALRCARPTTLLQVPP